MIIAIIILLLLFLIDPLFASIMLGLAIIMGIVSSSIGQKKEKERAKKREEIRKRIEENMASAEECVEKEIKTLIERYGKLTNIVRLEGVGEKADIKKQFIVFGDSNLLYITGKVVPFKDIISYHINDDYKIKHGKVEYTGNLKTSTNSLLGRSAAGAVVGGGVGAIIGASSASKNTTISATQKDDTIVHDYSLSINIRSLESPLIRLNIGESTQKAEEINAILAYIVSTKEV